MTIDEDARWAWDEMEGGGERETEDEGGRRKRKAVRFGVGDLEIE